MSLLLLFGGVGTPVPPVDDTAYFRRYINDVESRDNFVAILPPIAAAQTRFSAYLLQTGNFVGYLLEDDSGVYLLENDMEQDYFRRYLNDTEFRDN